MTEENTVTIELSKDEQAVVDAIEKLTVVQAANVAKYFEETYGISAAAAAPAAAAAVVEEEEKKTAYNVVIKECGPNKIKVIKLIREITGAGLADAKGMAEKAGGTIKENVKTDEAEAMKKKFEEVGATVELV